MKWYWWILLIALISVLVNIVFGMMFKEPCGCSYPMGYFD